MSEQQEQQTLSVTGIPLYMVVIHNCDWRTPPVFTTMEKAAEELLATLFEWRQVEINGPKWDKVVELCKAKQWIAAYEAAKENDLCKVGMSNVTIENVTLDDGNYEGDWTWDY